MCRSEIGMILKELEERDCLEIEEINTSLPEESNESVIKRRSGNVLGHGTILKCDHFPGCQRKGLTPVIKGMIPNKTFVMLIVEKYKRGTQL